MKLEEQNLNEAEKPQLNIGAVSGSVFIIHINNISFNLTKQL